MAALLVDVEFAGNAHAAHGDVEEHAVLGQHLLVVAGVDEEGGRGGGVTWRSLETRSRCFVFALSAPRRLSRVASWVYFEASEMTG